jgi:hypothetical protein
LNQLATFHGRSLISGGTGFSHAVINASGENLFSICLQRLLEMIIYPSCCDYGISSDRIDAFASTLINLVAMDVTRWIFFAKYYSFSLTRLFMLTATNRFNSCLHTLILQQPTALQQPMAAILGKLTTSNGVDINRFDDKRNRLLFVQNMRVFVSEIQPLIAYR